MPSIHTRTGLQLLGLAVLLTTLFTASPGLAHKAGLSRGNYQLEDNTLRAELVFSHDDFVALGRALGFADNWAQGGESKNLAREILKSIVATGGNGKPCVAKLSHAKSDKDALKIEGVFSCDDYSKAELRLRLLERLPKRHRHAANGSLLTRQNPLLRLHKTASKHSQPNGFWGFLVSGIEHILFGFDHLVFLFGLVLVGRRWFGVIKAVTAFTVAHSITLALALLKIWAPSGNVIEPLIALSVAYVGVENFFVKDAEKRWRVTLPFGLIHGFGFAGALGELALPSSQLPTALFAFNLGVELGQVAVLCLILPLLLALHKRPWFEEKDRGVRALSIAIVATGIFWFVGRVFG